MEKTVELNKALAQASKEALRENRILRLATLIARDGKLIKLNPDGTETVIGNTKRSVKVSKQRYKLK